MKHLKVFYCSNNHIIYAEDYPDICKQCESMSFYEVQGIQISVEELNGVSEKSENDYSQE